MSDECQPPQQADNGISTYNEKHLHAALKRWYAQPGDRLEESVDGYVVDLVRGDLLVEIQTRNFGAIRRKLIGLTDSHRVRLVYPIAREKWIVKMARDGRTVAGRRKSPKRGRVEQLFQELVSLPQLLCNDRFSLEVLLIQEEEVRRPRARRWRRKDWQTQERRLLRVLDRRLFGTPADLAALIPPELAEPFTTADLASAAAIPRWLAQKMTYCLRQMGAVEVRGKQGNALLYARNTA